MPAKGKGGSMVTLGLKMKEHERKAFNRARLKKNMSQREYVLWMMAKTGEVVPLK